MIKNIIIFTSFSFSPFLFANDISTLYGENIKLASGYEQLVKESPSTVSVITSEDIEKIGAITIEDVLETIPGIHVTYANGYVPVYTIRGIGPADNGAVLIYLDGISINNAKTSSSFYSLSRMAKNIEKIEIIKGPGSALYGTNAFSGVINIITKKNGADSGAFAGSHDTFGGWLNSGTDFDNFKVSFSAQGLTTKGGNEIIESDRQSFIDSVIGTNASLAPGGINRGRDEIDLKLETSYKDKANLYFRYITKKDYGFGVGLGNSLDNSGEGTSDAWLFGANYALDGEVFKTKFDINYTGSKQYTLFNAFPTGAFGGLFTTPVSTELSSLNHELETKVSTIYSGINNHKLHMGVGFRYDSIEDVTDKRNYIEGPFNSLFPTGSLQSAQSLGALPIISGSPNRYNYYGFIQDEWKLYNDLSLTAGVRADYFSDFDLSVNPRVSLVWLASSSLTAKLMYGRAFNAPSFFEFYTNPGLSVTGNRNLNPETIQTVELSLFKTWPHRVMTQLNLFWYETNDLITETVLSDGIGNNEFRLFENAGGANAYGVEFDFGYQIIDTLTLNFNYSYLNLNPKSSTFDSFIVVAPTHQLFASIDWEFLPNWSANIRSNSILGRQRESSDIRTDIKDYTKLDFTVNAKRIAGVLDLTFKIDNIIDSDIREPSVDPIISGDYPLEGRTFMGIISMKF